jgi:hypothetical protein
MHACRFATAVLESDPDWHGDDNEGEEAGTGGSCRGDDSKQQHESTTISQPRVTTSVSFVYTCRNCVRNTQGVEQKQASGGMQINSPQPIMQPPIQPLFPTPHGSVPAHSYSISAATPVGVSSFATPNQYSLAGTPVKGSTSVPVMPLHAGAKANAPAVEASVSPLSKFQAKSFWRSTLARAGTLCVLRQREKSSHAEAADQDVRQAAGSGLSPQWLEFIQPTQELARSLPPQFGGPGHSYPVHMHPGPAASPLSPPPSPGMVVIQQVLSSPEQQVRRSTQSPSPSLSALFMYSSPASPQQSTVAGSQAEMMAPHLGTLQYQLMPNLRSPMVPHSLGHPQMLGNPGYSQPPMAPPSMHALEAQEERGAWT